MAIARGAGTEIIRSAHFEDVGVTTRKLIIGVQHHIYTVLNIIFRCVTRSGSQLGYFTFYGFDAGGGTSNQRHEIMKLDLAAGETFVWNDKFSFNGYEPEDEGSGVVGAMTTAAEQDAIADQGSSVSQYLQIETDSDSTFYDCMITFIDQNNS